MKLRAYELADGGAILVDEGTNWPLAIPPGCFRDEDDAQAFLVWNGEPCGDVRHLRDAAYRWRTVRAWSKCPTAKCCGRVEPGAKVCASCACDEDFAAQQVRQGAA